MSLLCNLKFQQFNMYRCVTKDERKTWNAGPTPLRREEDKLCLGARTWFSSQPLRSQSYIVGQGISFPLGQNCTEADQLLVHSEKLTSKQNAPTFRYVGFGHFIPVSR